VRLLDEDNLFIVLAATGLVALFGGQAFVNILVNLQLFPSKGLTLPLVSYGGSSTIAQCFLVGLLLAITRRNPCLTREKVRLARHARAREASDDAAARNRLAATTCSPPAGTGGHLTPAFALATNSSGAGTTSR
jgi:hypothetical protein